MPTKGHHDQTSVKTVQLPKWDISDAFDDPPGSKSKDSETNGEDTDQKLTVNISRLRSWIKIASQISQHLTQRNLPIVTALILSAGLAYAKPWPGGFTFLGTVALIGVWDWFLRGPRFPP